MCQILILVLALSMDTFAASMAYGANGVFIGWKKIILMNGIGGLCLFGALSLGGLLDLLVPETLTKTICFLGLMAMGLVKLWDFLIRRYQNRHQEKARDFKFSFSGIRVIISVYANPLTADLDGSKSLSWKESLVLAAAMSVDNLAVGAPGAFMHVSPWEAAAATFLTGVLSMYIGSFLGKRLRAKGGWELSWLSALLFILLAFSKL